MCVFLFFLSYVCLIVYLLNRWCIFVTSHLSHSQSTTNTKQCDAYLASLRIASKSTEVLLYYFFFVSLYFSLSAFVGAAVLAAHIQTNKQQAFVYVYKTHDTNGPIGIMVVSLCAFVYVYSLLCDNEKFLRRHYNDYMVVFVFCLCVCVRNV